MKFTKDDWREIAAILATVPEAARGPAYEATLAKVQAVLTKCVNELAPSVVVEEYRFAVTCALCRRDIALSDSYICHPTSGIYSHYDCNMAAASLSDDDLADHPPDFEPPDPGTQS